VIDKEDKSAHIDGWCKWSVQSAMVTNAISMRTEPNMWAFTNADPTKLEFITLFEACERWNIDMEVYSEEPGCCFQEHYVVVNGDLICEECVEWNEYCLDNYDNKADVEEVYDIEISDEEWENGGYISRGGFDSWDFEI
jgi:hypothetical protein